MRIRDRGRWLGALLAGALAVPFVAMAADTGSGDTATGSAGRVTEYHLDNGLKLIVKEDHRAPVVVSQVWYKVGSSYESAGTTGVSHVLEHMMFKGTKRHPAGEFSRIIAEQGGRENAFTSRDYTAYFQQLAADRLEVSMELEADRMHNLRLDPEEFTKERAVVQEERSMRTDDDPQALTRERFMASAYLSSPYRNPVIGWPSDIANLDVADLQHWYDRWYAPNNAILVVAGDVDPAAVRAMAARTYGKVPRRQVGETKPRTEVPPRGERRVQVEAPAEVPYLLMGYQVPSLVTADQEWEAYALEVLAGILDGGSAARLARDMVRGASIASGASAGYGLFDRQESLFSFSATPASGHELKELEAALDDEVKRLQDEPVSETELARVKAQVVAGRVFEQDSLFYQAMEIGILETVGLGWQVADEYVPKVQAVTAEQVQAVARKYLRPERRTVAWLDPQPIDPAHPPHRGGSMSGGDHVR